MRQQDVMDRVKPDLLNRLKRIEGQARGLQRMLEEQRECADIVTQVAALKAAVEKVGLAMVGCLLESAIRQAVEDGTNTDQAIETAKKLLGTL